ncbi:MAG: 1-acyl-sn-glycerol-3-phosphate acyltransferase [Fimbriimonadaceae bacterium]|nr:1-acyl-sn-glycerol-3-phosphate acyltransferase [Fimbriimonadaceae bacterium]
MKPENEITIERHGPITRNAHWFVVALLWPLMFLLGPVKVVGRYRVPKTGGLLILSNHLADVDPVVIWYASRRPIHFMAKSELFEMKILGSFIRRFKAFPVRRGEPDRQAIKHAIKLLKAGECVGIFPEGQLSEDGRLQPILPGIGLIAKMAGVPILCVGLRGTQRIMPYGTTTPRPAFGGVSVEWGEVKQFPKDAEIEEIVAWVDSQLRNLTDQFET